MGLSDFLNNNWATVLVAAIGLAAIYLLLPRPRRYPTIAGSALALAALVLTGAFLVRIPGVDLESLLFYLFSGLAIAAAGIMITNSNPARAALAFTLVVMASCGLFLLLAAPFLAAATTIVYAGAIIVTFLFVLMLAQQTKMNDADARSREPALVTITGFILLVITVSIIKSSPPVNPAELKAMLEGVEKMSVQARELREAPAADMKAKLARAEKIEQFATKGNKQLEELRQWWNDAPRSPLWKSGLELSPTINDTLYSMKKLRDDVDDLKTAAGGGEAATVDAAWLRVGKSLETLEEKLLAVKAEGQDLPEELEQNLTTPTLEVTGKEPRLHRVTHQSELSGPATFRLSKEIRRDEKGRPHLPGNNTAFLGKTLFSDYLLAVEMGGALLLVATIAAIVIAMRRQEQASPETTNPPGDVS